MGEITRNIFNMCRGDHIYYNILNDDKLPEADIYLLHCFINHSEKFQEFNASGKIISIMHSDYKAGCRPSKHSDKIIVLTDSYRKEYGQKILDFIGKKISISDNINCGSINKINKKLDKHLEQIEIINSVIREYLFDLPMNYQSNNMIRICRNVPDKFADGIDDIIKEILIKYRNTFTLITDKPRNSNIYTEIYDIGISQNDIKKLHLATSPIYVIANGEFIEGQSLAMLEAMASGSAIVAYPSQSGFVETIGNAGFVVDSLTELKNKVEYLIKHEDERIRLGTLARERVKQFSNSIMIDKYNNLFDRIKGEK